MKVGTQMLLIRTKLTFIRIDHSAVFIVRQYSFSGCYSKPTLLVVKAYWPQALAIRCIFYLTTLAEHAN